MISKFLFSLKNTPINTVVLPLINTKFITSSFSSKKQGGKETFQIEDAEQIFEKFFKENPPREKEKSFFGVYESEKAEALSFNPYKVLEIPQNSSKETIKQAYRKLAMKYHPKNDSSLEAGEKFIEIAKAYEILCEEGQNKGKNKLSGNRSFISEFNDLVQNHIGLSENDLTSKNARIAELFNSSTTVKRLGDKKEIKVYKEYNKDGNIIKITRVETFNEDGSVEISETYDDGHDAKTHKFMQGKGVNDPISILNHIESHRDDLFTGKTKK